MQLWDQNQRNKTQNFQPLYIHDRESSLSREN